MTQDTLLKRLESIEPHLRNLLPPQLYTQTWLNPNPENLQRTYQHLTQLHAILKEYIPRMYQAATTESAHHYMEIDGAFLFTDLSGFTSLVEAYAPDGAEGAVELLDTLNTYFHKMIDIVYGFGGDLLEFTGDAMLFQFRAYESKRQDADKQALEEVQCALRAALLMQRRMEEFAGIETPRGKIKLSMRIGIHHGKYFLADIGTPMRKDRVLFGTDILETKHTEQVGKVGRVCVSQKTYDMAAPLDEFEFERADVNHYLVIDDLNIREADLQRGVFFSHDVFHKHQKKTKGMPTLEDDPDTLLQLIDSALVNNVLPLSVYLPRPIVRLIVDNVRAKDLPSRKALMRVDRCKETPQYPHLSNFTQATVIFVNLLHVTDQIDQMDTEDREALILSISEIFAHINAAVEGQGGVLKKMTYNIHGPDLMIFFGVPTSHADDALRAAETAIQIQGVVTQYANQLEQTGIKLQCQIGISRGSVFAAEIGSKTERREYNIVGDAVNTAARLAYRANGDENEILITDHVYFSIAHKYDCDNEQKAEFKGKRNIITLFTLNGPLNQATYSSLVPVESDEYEQSKILDMLKRVFPFLNDIMIDYVARTSEFVRYPANKLLCKEGEIEHTFYILVSGSVDVVRHHDGLPIRVGRLEPGACFGEIALILNRPRTADIQTATPVSVIEIKREIFDNYISTQPEIIVNITRLLIDRMLNQEKLRLVEIAEFRKLYRKPLVFISYSHKDVEFAARLQRDLERRDIPTWMDHELKAGEAWRKQIAKTLKDMQVMIVVLSPEAVESKYVTDEWDIFQSYEKPVLPLMYRNCQPIFGLNSLQWIDFTKADDKHCYENALEHLVIALQRLLKKQQPD